MLKAESSIEERELDELKSRLAAIEAALMQLHKNR